MKNINPFPLFEYIAPKYFCNRRTETERIISAITNRRNIAVVAENGIGKTTLIKHVFYSLSDIEDYGFYFADFEKNENTKNFIETLLFAVFNKNGQLQTKTLKKIKNILPQLNLSLTNDVTSRKKHIKITSEISDYKKTVSAIFEYVKNKHEKTVFAFDNADTLITAGKTLNEIMGVDALSFNNVSFVFTAADKFELKKIFPQNYQMEIIELKKIETKKYSKFIKKRFGKSGVNISKETVDFILKRSNGNTYYTQYICNKIFNSGEKNITVETAENTFRDILKEYERTFIACKYLLSAYQWKLLKAIAIQGEAKGITSAEFISKYELNAPSSVKTAITALLEKKLVVRNRFRYRLTNVFLEKWLSEN